MALFVHGDSGVGKSLLIQRFLEGKVRYTDAVVLAGRCYERESVPYKAVDSVIDALTRFLRRLPPQEVPGLLPRDLFPMTHVFPVLQRVDAIADRIRCPSQIPDRQQLRRRAFAALRELLARLGDRQPLIVAIDDLQWGDADSAALLIDVLRPPEPPTLLVLGAYRREESTASPFLAELLEWRAKSEASIVQRELAVDPLSSGEACQLVELLSAGKLPSRSRDAHVVAAESGGSPFFLRELVEFIQGRGAVERSASTESISLEDVLWRRIERLPGDAQGLLEVIAVAGRPICQADACRAAGVLAGGEAAIAALRSARLVRSTRPEHDEFETYHDRVREIVVGRLTAASLAERHQGLAAALERGGHADPEVLAAHYGGARPGLHAARGAPGPAPGAGTH